MKFSKYIKPVILFFAICFNSYAQEIVNARFEQQDERITIYYELKGDPSKEYEVRDLVLKNHSDPGFEIKPENITGAIGEGMFAEGTNTIIWNVNQQEQDLLAMFDEGEEFYFQFTARPVKGGIPWYYYVGGSVIAGGGVALYMISTKSSSEPADNIAPVDKYPDPPGRP